MNRHAVVVVAASIGSILSPGLVLHGLEKETLYRSVKFMHFWQTYMCMCVCFLCYYVIGT